MSVFGEIVEAGTRVAWEDWDDISPATENIELKWTNEFQLPEMVNLFIIVDGINVSDTYKVSEKDSIELVSSIKEASLNLYKVKVENTYYCILKDYNLLLSSEIVELLNDFIEKSKYLLVFMKKPLTDYQTSNLTDQSSILRCLCTTKSLKNQYCLNFPKLEQPNIISGVAAGVLTLREHLNLAAMVVVQFVEFLENVEMDEISNMLLNLNISVSTNQMSNNITNSNLYI